ncbi:MAG TPA: DinB family protein [Candidatus Sulfotelmatobacter sp.]|nr:DinB family protein [Candidatus Sulfotelmatobacter sp.]
MKLTEFFLAELEREAAATRLALERVPEGQNNWKPHPKSMELGYLASLVATMPAWIVSMVQLDEVDLRSPEAGRFKPIEWHSRQELLAALDQAVAEARAALQSTDEEHLLSTWKFVVGGQTVSQNPRHVMIAEAVFSHLAHHRGQLTVYLRLNESPVPALYGPSADEGRFERVPA